MKACVSGGQLYFAMTPARNTSNTKIFMMDTARRGPILNKIIMVIKSIQLMTYKAKVAVCSEIHTKHSTQNEHHVEFFIVKPGGT
jgi:hypothetical protein